MLKSRTQQFIAFIFFLYKHRTVLNLMKPAYLVDYFYYEKRRKTISGFDYKLYSFGVFDESVYGHVERLVKSEMLKSRTNFTRLGLEYVSYDYTEMVNELRFKNEAMPDISLKEFYFIQNIIYNLFYYSEKDLTKLVYNTRPIKDLGAKTDNLQGICHHLKFR